MRVCGIQTLQPIKMKAEMTASLLLVFLSLPGNSLSCNRPRPCLTITEMSWWKWQSCCWQLGKQLANWLGPVWEPIKAGWVVTVLCWVLHCRPWMGNWDVINEEIWISDYQRLKRVVNQKAGNANIATNIHHSKIWVDVPWCATNTPGFNSYGCLFWLHSKKATGFESPWPRSGRRLSRMEEQTGWTRWVPMLPGLLVPQMGGSCWFVSLSWLSLSYPCFSINLSWTSESQAFSDFASWEENQLPKNNGSPVLENSCSEGWKGGMEVQTHHSVPTQVAHELTPAGGPKLRHDWQVLIYAATPFPVVVGQLSSFKKNCSGSIASLGLFCLREILAVGYSHPR